MDPALWELLRAEEDTDPQRPVEAIIRFSRPGVTVPDVRIVATFGPIATCRIAAGDVIAVRAHRDVVSLKAARRLGIAQRRELGSSLGRGGSVRQPTTMPSDVRRPLDTAPTGSGVVIGCVDWGLDFASPAFRHALGPDAPKGLSAGGTRLLALWDQRDLVVGDHPTPYGYGVVHERAAIDRALLESKPYEALGYHPAVSDRGRGTHGTHVLDIAAGNGRGSGPVGVAPEADLVFVHLADRDTGGLANLGDSVRLLEAIDFIRMTSWGRPCVINTSVGRHGGPHDGTTLAELAVDHLLSTTPGLVVVKSCGNYFRSRAHASGKLARGEVRSLAFRVDPDDATPNELEIWYDGNDELGIHLTPPERPTGARVPLGARADIVVDQRLVGRVHHRAADPNNGANHVDAFLFAPALGGSWTVTLEGRRVRSGEYHAWLERDDFCPPCQTRFAASDSDPSFTTGTLANGRLDLTVGAYDGHDPARPPAPFSSAGPTRDGRAKPDLAAPGMNILAARSAPAGAVTSPGMTVRKSGTSMAAPHVAGAVALCLQIGLRAGRLLTAAQVRDLVLSSSEPPAVPDPRLGAGYLHILRLLEATRAALAVTDHQPRERHMDTSVLTADPAHAYRELLYRPTGRLARTVDSGFDVLGLPGRLPDRAPQSGDVLMEVELGHLDRGRCTVLNEPQALLLQQGSLLPGQLLLRGRTTDAEEEPDHVRQARAWWRKEFGADPLLSKVVIMDYANVPSEAVRKLGFAAWTNSATRIYVAARAAADAATLDRVLRHEARHIRQFAATGRPRDYQTMLRYEQAAYGDDLARLAVRSRELTDLTKELRSVDKQVTDTRTRVGQLDAVLAAPRGPETPEAREQRYRRFLRTHELVPEHRRIDDLYEPPPAARNPAAQEAEQMDGGDAEQVAMPRVKTFRFHNTGTSDANNTCAICPIPLGVGAGGTASNGMEIRFQLEGHRAGMEYDVLRTRRDSLWQRVGGVWARLGTNPMGTNDDHRSTDEALTPRAGFIYVVDRPGFPGLALPAPAQALGGGDVWPGVVTSAAAQDVVARFSFAEWVNARHKGDGIDWTRLEFDTPMSDGTPRKYVFWRCIVWITRTGAGNFVLDAARSRIDRGSITSAVLNAAP